MGNKKTDSVTVEIQTPNSGSAPFNLLARAELEFNSGLMSGIRLGGIGLAAGSVWFLIALPVAILAVTKLAIEREERYLAELFGAAYLDYKGHVRRWF
jgi:hypothetical protein